MRLSLIVPALVGLSQLVPVASAAAAVACPPAFDDHPLRRVDGGSLYLTHPEGRMLQAPATTRSGPNGPVNTWRFGDARNLFLVCRYDDSRAEAVVRLPPGVTICHQEARIGVFACQ